MLRSTNFFCKRLQLSNHALNTVLHLSSKAKKKFTFEASLGQHLIDIKKRHQEMSLQLMESDKLQVSEITRISKDCAELSRVVEYVDERNALIQSMFELEAMENEESGRQE